MSSALLELSMITSSLPICQICWSSGTPTEGRVNPPIKASPFHGSLGVGLSGSGSIAGGSGSGGSGKRKCGKTIG